MIQLPQFFEFSSAYLKFLANQLYLCQYGTFMADCERERTFYQTQTLQLWQHPLSKHYQNPFYDSTIDRVKCIPRTAYFELALWKELYFDFSPYYNQIQQPSFISDDDYLFSFTDQKDKIMRRTKEYYGFFMDSIKKQMQNVPSFGPHNNI